MSWQPYHITTAGDLAASSTVKIHINSSTYIRGVAHYDCSPLFSEWGALCQSGLRHFFFASTPLAGSAPHPIKLSESFLTKSKS
jgi:hypothetical protein